MPKESQQLLETIYWKEIRDETTKVNPEFAKIIDAIDPGKSLPFGPVIKIV